MVLRRYELIDDDQVGSTPDAITVSIPADPLTGEASLGAGVAWPERTTSDGIVVPADQVPGPSVEAAFDRAHELAAALGLQRIVVNMDPVVTWNPDWGDLVD